LITQALSVLQNSPSERSAIVLSWAEKKDTRLLALLTGEGVQQMVRYGVAGSVLQALIKTGHASMVLGYRVPDSLSKLVHNPKVPASVQAQALRLLGNLVTWQIPQSVPVPSSGTASVHPVQQILNEIEPAVQKMLSAGPQAAQQAVDQILLLLAKLHRQVSKMVEQLGSAAAKSALESIDNALRAFEELRREPLNPWVVAAAVAALAVVVAELVPAALAPVGL
jgi:hypothetical protein